MSTLITWESTSLANILSESEGTPWGAVIRALLPWWRLQDPRVGTAAQRRLAYQIQKNRERIAAIDADELVAVFASQGRLALYVRCVEVSDLDLAAERMLVEADRADADYDTKMAHLKASAEAVKRATGVGFDKFTEHASVVAKAIFDFADAIGKAKR